MTPGSGVRTPDARTPRSSVSGVLGFAGTVDIWRVPHDLHVQGTFALHPGQFGDGQDALVLVGHLYGRFSRFRMPTP